MKRNVFYILLLSAFALQSCGTKTGVMMHHADLFGRYGMRVPGNFVPSTELHPYAALQLKNSVNNIYTIGLDDSKEKLEAQGWRYSLEDYAYFAASTVAEGIDEVLGQQVLDYSLEHTNCFFSTIKGVKLVDGKAIQLAYEIAVFETPESFFQLISWTTCDHQDDLSRSMSQMICSFSQAPLRIEHSADMTQGGAAQSE